MTTEIEKTFFNTFGIELKWECIKPSDERCNECGCCELKYPQISDTHYLKLISIMSKELSMIVNLLSENIQELKSEILDKCIRNYHRHKEAFSEAHREYADDFKHQVRTLFEEG